MAEAPSTAESRGNEKSRWRRYAFVPAAAALVALHAALVYHFDPPEVLFNERPISVGDFRTHYAQAGRVIEGLEGWGKTWVYDVHLLAGHPTGTIFDADNKAWELWTYALYKLGLPKGTAFNLYLLLAHVLLLPVIYLSARLFGVGRWGALLAAALGSMLWFFDSFLHFCWSGGMVSYAMASYFFLLPLSLFYRFLQGDRLWYAPLVGLSMGIGHLIHPYSFFIMLVPMSLLYLRAFAGLGKARQAAVLAIVVIVFAINAYWLLVAIRFWHYILDSGYCGQTTLRYLPADFLGLLLDPYNTGLTGTRTGFRFLSLGAAAAMLWWWRREKDPRFTLFAAGISVLLLLAYTGGYLVSVAQIQPYRHIASATFLSLVPAAALVEVLWQRRLLSSLPGLARAMVLVLLLPGLQHLARDVIYFFPEKLPPVPPFIDGSIPALSATGYPPHFAVYHGVENPSIDLLVRWAKNNADNTGRILIQDGMDGEELSWRTDLEILGGFQLRNLEHAYANLFRREFHGNIPKDRLRQYLQTYAVKWLVISSPKVWFDDKPDLLKLAARFDRFRIYRVRLDVDLFQQGSGRIKATTNRIEVRGTDPEQTLLLRYHWLETLVCEPGCAIERGDNAIGGVGFIRIPAPHPRDLVIRNAY